MLSESAKKFGLKTEWKGFQENFYFNDITLFLEICKRIENIEEKLNEK